MEDGDDDFSDMATVYSRTTDREDFNATEYVKGTIDSYKGKDSSNPGPNPGPHNPNNLNNNLHGNSGSSNNNGNSSDVVFHPDISIMTNSVGLPPFEQTNNNSDNSHGNSDISNGNASNTVDVDIDQVSYNSEYAQDVHDRKAEK